MRSYDLTAGLCVLALAFSAVGGGGPLLGEERDPALRHQVLTVFAWIASPLAFPTIALAILYFPDALAAARPLSRGSTPCRSSPRRRSSARR